jgi:hypothetical protein
MATVSLEIDRQGRDHGFASPEMGGIGRFLDRPWPAPEKMLKSLRYRSNLPCGYRGSKNHNGNPGLFQK